MTSFQYIIVDDGSSDNSRDIITSFATTDQRIEIVAHDVKLGAAAARNTGLRLAKGQYICFLDGDDIWEIDYLEAMLAEIEAQGDACAAVFCHSRVIDETGKITTHTMSPKPGAYDLPRVLAEICPPGNGSCLIIRRRAFEEVGGFDTNLIVGQDSHMWLKILDLSSMKYFWCVERPLVFYRERRGALTKSFKAERAVSLQWRLDTYIKYVPARMRWRVYVNYANYGSILGEMLYDKVDDWVYAAVKTNSWQFLINIRSHKKLAAILLMGCRRYRNYFPEK